ncbi:hypothetical protein ABBQ38_000088 [Trebouxia sp. C0009 RCD-2024]
MLIKATSTVQYRSSLTLLKVCDYSFFSNVKEDLYCTVLVALISIDGGNYGRPLYTFIDAEGSLLQVYESKESVAVAVAG